MFQRKREWKKRFSSSRQREQIRVIRKPKIDKNSQHLLCNFMTQFLILLSCEIYFYLTRHMQSSLSIIARLSLMSKQLFGNKFYSAYLGGISRDVNRITQNHEYYQM